MARKEKPWHRTARNPRSLTSFFQKHQQTDPIARPDDPPVDDDRRARRVHRLRRSHRAAGVRTGPRQGREPGYFARALARSAVSARGRSLAAALPDAPRCGARPAGTRLRATRLRATRLRATRLRATRLRAIRRVNARRHGRKPGCRPAALRHSRRPARCGAVGLSGRERRRGDLPAELTRGLASPGVSGVYTAIRRSRSCWAARL